MAEDGTRDLRFDAPASVVKVFIFWLFHDNVPSFDDFTDITPPGSSEYEAREQYQILLIQTWMFANVKQLPAMQNAIMRHFFEEIDVQFWSDVVLQKGLLKSRRRIPMRKALIEAPIWLDDKINVEDGDEDEELFDQLKLDWMDGFDQDYEQAVEAYEQRCKKRGTADDSLVKEA